MTKLFSPMTWEEAILDDSFLEVRCFDRVDGALNLCASSHDDACDPDDCIVFCTHEEPEIVFRRADYNVTWRCWSRRPTEDERRAAKWDDEDNKADNEQKIIDELRFIKDLAHGQRIFNKNSTVLGGIKIEDFEQRVSNFIDLVDGLIAERNAAIKDMKQTALYLCCACKHYHHAVKDKHPHFCGKIGERTDFEGTIACGMFEWRGLCTNNGGIEDD